MVSTGFPGRGAQVKRKADGLIGEVYASDPSKDLLTLRWSARSGHNTLVCTSEQFFRDWDLTRGVKTDWTGRLIYSFLLITVLFVLFVWMHRSVGPSEFTLPPSVLDQKTAVVDGKAELDFTMKLGGLDAGNWDMLAIIRDMESIMRHELKESGSEQSILFHIVGVAAADDYGRRSTDLIGAFDIQYSMEDIKQINWDNPSEIRLLNLGRVSGITPAGAKVAGGYCEKNRGDSQVFCDSF
jgi:hypothetical protein